MDTMKMGLKHVILQRIQCDHSNDSNIEQKKITDFSIKRILSSETPSTNKNNDTNKFKSDILDLSKNSDLINHSSAIYNQKLLSSVDSVNYFKGQYLNYPITSGYSDSIIRPKVCKFLNPNSMNNHLSSNSYQDCSIYYQNFEYQKYPYYKNSAFKGTYLDNTNVLFEKCFVKSSLSVNLNPNSTVSQLMRKEMTNRTLQDTRDTETSLKCTICDKVFGCSTTLMSHEKTHKSPRYECLDCGKGFSQLRNYKYHLSVHRGTKEFAAKCPECGKIFNDKGYLSSHMKIHRNKKEYECPYCPKSFNQRVAFNMHVRIHTGVKPHKCVECGKRFSRKMLLKQHMRTHSGEKPYQCTVCGKSFADRSNMTLHHRLHSGIKPFNCPICPKAFTKKHHLKTHLNYHTGCKPYVCPHPNCKQAFTQSSNMRTHAKKCQFKPSGNYLTVPSSDLGGTVGFSTTSTVPTLHSNYMPPIN